MMISRKVNQQEVHFISGSIDPATFTVAEFSGVERISTLYRFDLTLFSDNAFVDPHDLLGKPATLFFYRDGKAYPYSGIINKFEFVGKNADATIYKACLVPKLWLCSLTTRTRIFYATDIISVIKEILDSSNITDYKIVTKKYLEKEYIVQYRESDLDFISRIMENAGIWFFFNEEILLPEEVGNTCSFEKVTITDDSSMFKDIDGKSSISFHHLSGLDRSNNEVDGETISKISFETHVVPQDVIVKNYNCRKPDIEVLGRKSITKGHKGIVYDYGDDLKDSFEADSVAEIISKRLQSHQLSANGVGNCRGFRAGSRFELSNHFRDEMNSRYMLTDVFHRGGYIAGSSGVVTYENSFKAIPVSMVSNYVPDRKSVIPKVNGVLTAIVASDSEEYAQLDEIGRYRVNFPADFNDKKESSTDSKYIRLAQPYSGTGYGFHLPSHRGTELLVACIDGNPDKPVGIGTIPNADTISPVVDRNKFQNIIRTAGGNEILMDDEDEKQKILLTTNGKHTLVMDDEKKDISIISIDNNSIIIDDTNSKVTLKSGKNKIEMCYSEGKENILITTANGHIINLDDTNKKLIIQSKGGHVIDLDDGGNKITLADKSDSNKVTLDGGGGLILESKEKIEIKTEKDLAISAVNITIDARAKIDARAAAEMKLTGKDVEVKGEGCLKVEGGMNMEVKGGAEAKFTGMMVDVSGSTSTKITGGIVMIN